MLTTALIAVSVLLVLFAGLIAFAKWAKSSGLTGLLERNTAQLERQNSIIAETKEALDVIEEFLGERSQTDTIDFHLASCLSGFEVYNDPEFLDVLETEGSGQDDFLRVYLKHNPDLKTDDNLDNIVTHLDEWADAVRFKIRDLFSNEFLEEVSWVLKFIGEFKEGWEEGNPLTKEIPPLDEVLPDYAPLSDTMWRLRNCKEQAELRTMVLKILRTKNRYEDQKSSSKAP